MDPGTILGVVSLTIQSIEICVKTFQRFREYRTTLHGIPDTLEECESRLVLLRQVVQRNQDEEKKEGSNSSQAHMRATYLQISKYVRRLDAIVKDLQKTPGDGLRKLLSKSNRSLRKEKEIEEIQQCLSRAVIDLTLGHVDNLRPPPGHVCVERISTAVHPVAKSPLTNSYGLPPNHISKFIGRKQTLSDIKNALLADASRTAAISLWGIGGQGKTQIALELVADAEVQKSYGPVLWINASSRSALGEQFGRIAAQMVRPGAVFPDLQSKIDFVETTLEQSPKPCLFVFDNFATSFELSQHAEFLPRDRPYSIIYISRHFDATFEGTSIMIPAMPTEDAVELLLERSGYGRKTENIEHSEEIVSRLGCLPLAILQAAAWLRSSRLPLNTFLHQFSIYIAFALDQPGQTSQSNRNVFTTWEMAMEAFSPDKKRCEEITHMLLACSILHVDVMNGHFASYLWQDFSHAPPWMAMFLTDQVWSYRKFAATVQQLSDFSLVNILDWRHGHCHFTLHPMVRQWLKLRVKISTLADTIFEVVRLVDAFVQRVRHHAMDSRTRNHVRLYIWSVAQALSEFEALEGSSELLSKKARTILDAKYTAALFLTDDPDFGGNIDYHLTKDIPVSATKALEDCHEGYARLLGPKDPLTLEVADRLGIAYIDDKDFDKAETIIRSTLELQGAVVSSALARWYAQQGKNEEAADLYQQVLSKSDDGSSVDLDQLTNIMWCAQNDIDCRETARAEQLLLRILRVARPEPQQDRIKATALEKLAGIYWDWTRRMEAQDMQLRAFHLCETVYGCEDARTIHVGHELARYYFTTYEWEKCESLYTTLIARYEVVHGPENLHTNQARHCHSHTLFNLGRSDEGEVAHTEVFYLLLANPGIKDDFVQSIFNCLVGVLDYPNKESEKTTLYEEVLRSAQNHLHERDDFRRKITDELAKHYMELGNYSEAEVLLREIVNVRKQISAEDYGHIDPNQDQQSRAGTENGAPDGDSKTQPANAAQEQTETDKEQAEAYEAEAEALRSEHFNAAVEAKEDLGINLHLQNKLEEAEELLRDVLDKKKNLFGTCDPSTLDTAHRLGEICEARGKLDEAEMIHQEFEVAALEMQIAKLQKKLKQGSHSHEVVMRRFEDKLGSLKIKCVEDGGCTA